MIKKKNLGKFEMIKDYKIISTINSILGLRVE